MDSLIQTVLVNVVPIATAAIYVARKIEGLGARMKNVEEKLAHLDEKRETIALIPSIQDRLRLLESVVFARKDID